MQYPLEKSVSICYSGRMDTEIEAFRHRIESLRKARGMSARALSLGIGQNSAYIQQLESGMRNSKLPGYLVLKALADVFEMTVEELIDVSDPVLAVRPRLTEADLYERFGIKPYEQPIAIEGIALSAGPGAGMPQDLDYTIPRKVKGSKYLWEAPVIGECMTDEIKPGEVVIYSTRLSAEIGRVMVALRDEEELIIKRLRLDGDKQVLRPNHGDDVPVDDRIRFLGRGVSVQRALL